MLHFDAAFRCCISMLHFDAIFRCYILCYISILHSPVTELCFAVACIFSSVYAPGLCGNASAESFDHVSPRHPEFFPSPQDQALRFLPFEFCVLPPHSFGYSIIHTTFLQDTPDYSGAAPDTPDYSSAAPDTPDYSGAAPVQEAIWIKNVEMRNFNHSIQEKS